MRRIVAMFASLFAPLFATLFVLGSIIPGTLHLASAANPPTSAPSTQATMLGLERLLVFPGSRTKGQTAAVVHPGPGCELVRLHSADGTRIAALFGKATTPSKITARSTLLFFYGNGMCMADSVEVFNHLRSLGVNVIMIDYPGYGMSDGDPTEPGCYAAADAAYDHLLTRPEVDPARIVATGWSLGGAIAIDLAGRRPVAGLATFSAFTNIREMGVVFMKKQFGGALAGVTLDCQFDNLAKISTLKCPIFLAHGSSDALVPPEMLDRLAKAAKMPVKTIHVRGAGHNDLMHVGGDSLFNRLKAFVDGLPAVTAESSTRQDR